MCLAYVPPARGREASDGCVCDIRTARGRGGPSGGDTMLEFDPVARRYGQKIRRAPDHVVLELADLAIGINQLPHHLDNADPALLIHRPHDDASEMIEIDRLPLDQRRGRDQMVRGAGIEPETAFDQAVKLALLDFGRFAVERDDVYQQRRRPQPVAGVVKGPTFVPGGRNDVGNELAKSVQHYFL